MDDAVCSELREAFEHYCRVYFHERDLDGVLATITPTITGFGNAADERVLPGEGATIMRRDIEQCPAPIAFTLCWQHIDSLSRDCGVVCAEFDLVADIGGQPFSLNGVRLSGVFVRRDAKWLLAHLHVSSPWHPLAEGEAYPLQELEARNRELEAMVNERTEELRRALDDVRRMARIDSVTGLANRVAFDENISREIGYARRYGAPLSMLLLDVDHFKKVNDRYGHLKGDQVLHQLATLIVAHLRGVDSVHRWGGEEFIVLLPNTTLEHAAVCAEYLRWVVETREFGLEHSITVSIGVARFDPDESCEDWVRRADEALYDAKTGGRNQVRQNA